MKLVFIEEFGKAFVPKIIRPGLRSYFIKAGITDVPYKLFGAFFYASLILTFVLYFYKVYPEFFASQSLMKVFIFTAIVWFVLPLAFMAAFGAATYIYLDLKIFNRTKKMEEVLPDFLRFVGENLRGGMPFEKSLWTAIKPEFGVLASEVRLAAKKVMTGESAEEALHEFTGKYDSPMMRRSFDLIIEGMKSGSEIADLIEGVIENIEETRQIKEEMKTANMTYIIFITFVVIVITPVLSTLSYQFLMVLKSFGARLGPSTAQMAGSGGIGSVFGNLSQISVEPEQFKTFSRQAIAVIAFFSSLIVSIINQGSIKSGIKYIPFFILGAELVYYAAMIIAASIFGSILAL